MERIHSKGKCLNAAPVKNNKCLAQQAGQLARLPGRHATYSTDLLMMIIRRRRSHRHSQFWLAHPERKPIMRSGEDCTAAEKVWRRGEETVGMRSPLQDLSLFAELLLNTVVALLTRGSWREPLE